MDANDTAEAPGEPESEDQGLIGALQESAEELDEIVRDAMRQRQISAWLPSAQDFETLEWICAETGRSLTARSPGTATALRARLQSLVLDGAGQLPRPNIHVWSWQSLIRHLKVGRYAPARGWFLLGSPPCDHGGAIRQTALRGGRYAAFRVSPPPPRRGTGRSKGERHRGVWGSLPSVAEAAWLPACTTLDSSPDDFVNPNDRPAKALLAGFEHRMVNLVTWR